LIAGLIVICWALLSSYNIFTGRTAAPEVFKIDTKEVPPITQEKIPITPEEIQKEMEKIMEEQLKEILPVSFLPEILNLAVWSMLAFILIFGGSQISSLGIKLIRPSR